MLNKLCVLLLVSACMCVSAVAQTAEDPYAIWRSNNRTNHELAYKAAQEYVRKQPSGPHAEELRLWIKAYEKVVASMGNRDAVRDLPSVPDPGEKALWDEAEKWNPYSGANFGSDKPFYYREYLSHYPYGTYAPLAETRLKGWCYDASQNALGFSDSLRMMRDVGCSAEDIDIVVQTRSRECIHEKLAKEQGKTFIGPELGDDCDRH